LSWLQKIKNYEYSINHFSCYDFFNFFWS